MVGNLFSCPVEDLFQIGGVWILLATNSPPHVVKSCTVGALGHVGWMHELSSTQDAFFAVFNDYERIGPVVRFILLKSKARIELLNDAGLPPAWH